MAGTTSAICSSFKAEEAQAAHCFNATVTATGATGTSGAAAITGLSTLVGVSVGMAVSGTGVAAGAVVATITSASAITVSPVNASTVSGTLTFTADVFNIALIVPTPAGTFGAGSTNYSNLSTDEVTGTGYTAGGIALTNVTPALASTTAWWTFNNAPATTWTSATISMGGAMIYNTKARLGGTTGRSVAVFNTGTQTVTAGTLTITYPQTANGLLSVT